MIVLILFGSHTVFGQTTNQQRRADAYYQNEQRREENSEGSSLLWDMLFGSANASPASGITADKFANGGWFAGQYANSKCNGLGINYFKTPNTEHYIFSNWKNDSINGLTIVSSDSYSFFGEYDNGKKDGFGMTSWSPNEPLNNKGYTDIVKYVGEYKQGEWHGYGILYFKDGTYKSGIWVDSVLNTELPKLEVLEALGF